MICLGLPSQKKALSHGVKAVFKENFSSLSLKLLVEFEVKVFLVKGSALRDQIYSGEKGH